MDFGNPLKQNPHFAKEKGRAGPAGGPIVALVWNYCNRVDFGDGSIGDRSAGMAKGSCGLERGRKLSHESRGFLLLSLRVGGRFKVVDAFRRWHQRIRITCTLPRALLDRGCPSLTSTLCMPLRADEGLRASAVACLTRSRQPEHGMAFAPRSSSLRPWLHRHFAISVTCQPSFTFTHVAVSSFFLPMSLFCSFLRGSGCPPSERGPVIALPRGGLVGVKAVVQVPEGDALCGI